MKKEWFSHCYDCRYKRWHGASKQLAREAANRHGRRNPEHRASYAEGVHPDELKRQVLLRKLGE